MAYVVQRKDGAFLLKSGGWILWEKDPYRASAWQSREEARNNAEHWGKQLGRVRSYESAANEYSSEERV